jgi:hypothetical protein
MARWKASGLVLLAACGHPPPAAHVDPFADDPVSVLATLEDRLAHAHVVTIVARGWILHVEPQRVSRLEVPRARWSSRRPHDRLARDTDPTQWGHALLLELVREGGGALAAQVARGRDPDILHGDVDAMLQVSDVEWLDHDPRTRTLVFDVTRADDGERSRVELTLDERGLPAKRVEQGEVEVYARFDVQ